MFIDEARIYVKAGDGGDGCNSLYRDRVNRIGTPDGGPGNPLVEYPLGQGRVIAMAWRLGPLYGDAPPEYRENFQHLTANLVAYLAQPTAWQSLATGAADPPAPPLPALKS